MFTKTGRERYNQQRQRTCTALGITIYQYNWLRRKGAELHKIYEDICNGVIEDDEYYTLVMPIEKEVNSYVKELGLFVYYQTENGLLIWK